MTRKEIRIDGIKAGRTFTRQIEGKGKRRRIVYRVGENHSPEFLRKHPKGSIWTSIPARQGTRKAGARFRKANKERLFTTTKTPQLPRLTTQQQRRTRKTKPISITKRTNVTEITTTKKLNEKGQIGMEFIITTMQQRKGRSKRMEVRQVGWSTTTTKPIKTLSRRQINNKLQEAEKNARGIFLVDAGIVEAYDEDIVFTEPDGPVLYRYFINNERTEKILQ